MSDHDAMSEQGEPMAPLRWLTVTVPAIGSPGTGPHHGLRGGVEPLRQALEAANVRPSDVVHLKFWSPVVLACGELAPGWAELFAGERPCVSVIASTLPAGVAMEITVAAVPGATVRSIHEAGVPTSPFPSAAVAGGHLFVGGLLPADTDAAVDAQAAEVFARLRTILDLAGSSPSGVGHMFVWYQDHSVRDVINGPYLELFDTPGDRPARHSVVRELPGGAALMIEIAGSVVGVRSSYTIGGLWHGGIGGIPNSLPFGTLCGEVLFSAGTYGRNPGDGEIPESLADQTRWALHYCHEFLRVAGMHPGEVGQVYVWLRPGTEPGDSRKVVEAAFDVGDSAPSVQVVHAALPGTNQIQIELVAQRRHGG